MMHNSKIIRKHFIFSGRVQEVGFRYSAFSIATKLGLTGWVRNEWDGSVEMEAQGTKEKIQKLVAQLDKRPFISIEYIEEQLLPTIDDEVNFTILN